VKSFVDEKNAALKSGIFLCLDCRDLFKEGKSSGFVATRQYAAKPFPG
jgi:hypothetical protein